MHAVAAAEPTRVRPSSRRRSAPPTPREIAKSNALRGAAAPWWLAKEWSGDPVADRRTLHQELGAKLTPTAHAILGIVRRAVRNGFPGLHVAAQELADALDVSRVHIFRGLRQLEAHDLVRRVHGYVPGGELGGDRLVRGRRLTGDRGARVWYRNRQVASVLVLGEAARRPRRRRACGQPATERAIEVRDRGRPDARARNLEVTPKPGPLSLPNGGERERSGEAEIESAAAPRVGVGSADPSIEPAPRSEPRLGEPVKLAGADLLGFVLERAATSAAPEGQGDGGDAAELARRARMADTARSVPPPTVTAVDPDGNVRAWEPPAWLVEPERDATSRDVAQRDATPRAGADFEPPSRRGPGGAA